MEVMDYGREERRKNDCTWKNNKHESTLHRFITYKICMFLEVQRSHDDEYVVFKSVKLDDPLIKKIEEVVHNFIMYPTKFLRHVYVDS